MYRVARNLILISLCYFTCIQLSAQFNILVGYNLGWTQSEELDDAIDAHNSTNTWYKNPLEKPGLIHGLQLGARYTMENISLTASFRSRGQTLEAEGIPPSSEESFERELSIRNNLFSFGLESALPVINWGVTIDFNSLNITGKNSDLNNRYDISKGNFISSHFYLNIELYGSDHLGLAIQPYYQWAWNEVDISEINNELGTNNSLNTKLNTFGISLLLVNGPRTH